MFTLLGGNPDIGGTWTNSIGSPVNNVFDPATMSSDVFTYTLTGTPPCSDDSSALSIIVNPIPSVSISGLSNSYCGASDPIILTGNFAPDGTFTGTDIIDNGNGTANYTHSTIGTHNITYTYTNGNGCTNVDTQIVNVYNIPVIDTILVTNATCGAFDGSATVNVSGGTPNYSYLWTNNDTTITADSLASGNYSITVSDNNACSTSQNFTVSNVGGGTLNVDTIRPVICYGDDDGAVIISVNGGTPSYTFQWENDTNITNQPIDTLYSLSPGNYSVTVIDGSGCLYYETVNISGPTLALEVSDTIITDVSCYGLSDGQLELVTIGGTPPYSYTWNPTGYSQNGNIYSGLPASSFDIIIVDSNGCNISLVKIPVIQPQQLENTLISSASSCYDDSTGTINAFVNGGTPPYTYLWSNGDTGNPIGGLVSGEFYVTITDTNSCSIIDTTTVVSPINILSQETITDVSCIGNNDGAINLEVNGGTSPYTLTWSHDASIIDTVAQELYTGDYDVT